MLVPELNAESLLYDTNEAIEDQLESRQYDGQLKRQLGKSATLESVSLESVVEPEQTETRSTVQTRTLKPDATEMKDDMALYMEQVRKYPLLTAEQEVELAKTIEAGLLAQHLLENDSTKDEATHEELEWLAEQGRQAKNLFISSNLRLAVATARKYTNRTSLPMLDIVQEANRGIIRAVEKFDYQKGYKFSTYATSWLRQTIERAIMNDSRTIRLPVHVNYEISKAKNAFGKLERELGRAPGVDEVAAESGIKSGRIMDLMRWDKNPVSLDTPLDESGGASFGDLITDTDAASSVDELLFGSEQAQLRDILAVIDEQMAGILYRRYGLIDGKAWSRPEIAKYYGISPERVRYLESKAVREIYEHFRDADSQD